MFLEWLTLVKKCAQDRRGLLQALLSHSADDHLRVSSRGFFLHIFLSAKLGGLWFSNQECGSIHSLWQVFSTQIRVCSMSIIAFCGRMAPLVHRTSELILSEGWRTHTFWWVVHVESLKVAACCEFQWMVIFRQVVQWCYRCISCTSCHVALANSAKAVPLIIHTSQLLGCISFRCQDVIWGFLMGIIIQYDVWEVAYWGLTEEEEAISVFVSGTSQSCVHST